MSDLPHTVKALVFDVFGTTVDWRTSLIDDFTQYGKQRGLAYHDWASFVDAWERLNEAAMDDVRRHPERKFINLDAIHQCTLPEVVKQLGIRDQLTDADLHHIVMGWHRLRPWPDSVAGLTRLKRKYIIGSLSNGNVAMLVDIAKFGGLHWDVVFSAELFSHYKPDDEIYLGAVRLLGLEPHQVMKVAAYASDLESAKRNGLRTAFVARPNTYGPSQTFDLLPTGEWDIVARDYTELADKMGC